MHMDQPIDIALRVPIAILDQQTGKLKVRAVQPLPGQLDAQAFAAADAAPVGEEVADLGVEVGVEDGEGGEERVEGLEGGFARAEEVFEEVGADLGVEPEETDLAVVDEIGAAFVEVGP